MIIYFECNVGCGIREISGGDLNKAERTILREVGTINEPVIVRKATKDDIANVASMGGWIPISLRKKRLKKELQP